MIADVCSAGLEPAIAPGPGQALEELGIPSGARIFECPECHHKGPSAELLGAHLERHREVLKPGPIPKRTKDPVVCPKGCGRSFIPGPDGGACTPMSEIKAHIGFCDGQAPLPMGAPKEDREEARVAKSELDCPKCGKKYDRGGHWRDRHVKGCDGQAEPAAKPRRAKPAAAENPEPLVVPDPNGSLGIKDRVLGLLEVEEERLEKELGNCKALIAAVREAGASDGRPT